MTEKTDRQELVQVLNREGNPTGEIMSLWDVHQKELPHEAVLVVIKDTKNQILAIVPGDSERMHAPGGHRRVIKSKKKSNRKPESQKRTAQREAKEELQLIIPRKNMRVVHSGTLIESPLRLRPQKDALSGNDGEEQEEINLQHHRIMTVVSAGLNRPFTKRDMQRVAEQAAKKGANSRAVLIDEEEAKNKVKKKNAQEVFSASFLHSLQMYFALRENQEKEKGALKNEIRSKVRKTFRKAA